MPAHEVAVLLPIYYTHRLEEVWDYFNEQSIWFNHENIAFDLHHYHCFGGFTAKSSQNSHLTWTRRYGTELQKLPGSCVGEWSLARPGRKKGNLV